MDCPHGLLFYDSIGVNHVVEWLERKIIHFQLFLWFEGQIQIFPESHANMFNEFHILKDKIAINRLQHQVQSLFLTFFLIQFDYTRLIQREINQYSRVESPEFRTNTRLYLYSFPLVSILPYHPSHVGQNIYTICLSNETFFESQSTFLMS